MVRGKKCLLEEQLCDGEVDAMLKAVKWLMGTLVTTRSWKQHSGWMKSRCSHDDC